MFELAVIFCVVATLIICASLRYQLKSTATHLVIQRRRRPTTDKVILADGHHIDVRETRRMEWEVYGRYYTGLDGRPISDGDPVAFAGEPVKAKEPEGVKCYCNYCRGRVGVHGEDAVALCKAQAEAAVKSLQAERRQVTQNIVAGGTVIQAGRNVVISGDAAGVIVTGDSVVIQQGGRIENLTTQDDADWLELGRHMNKLGYDISETIERVTRGFLG